MCRKLGVCNFTHWAKEVDVRTHTRTHTHHACIHSRTHIHTHTHARTHTRTHLLVHEGEVVLQFRVSRHQHPLPHLVILRPPSTSQHLQHIQHPKLHPPTHLRAVHLPSQQTGERERRVRLHTHFKHTTEFLFRLLVHSESIFTIPAKDFNLQTI